MSPILLRHLPPKSRTKHPVGEDVSAGANKDGQEDKDHSEVVVRIAFSCFGDRTNYAAFKLRYMVNHSPSDPLADALSHLRPSTLHMMQ